MAVMSIFFSCRISEIGTARIEGFRKKIHDKAEEKGQDVHCSIGLYRVKGAGRKLAECIMISDGLLYQAKKNGKDTYVIE